MQVNFDVWEFNIYASKTNSTIIILSQLKLATRDNTFIIVLITIIKNLQFLFLFYIYDQILTTSVASWSIPSKNISAKLYIKKIMTIIMWYMTIMAQLILGQWAHYHLLYSAYY